MQTPPDFFQRISLYQNFAFENMDKGPGLLLYDLKKSVISGMNIKYHSALLEGPEGSPALGGGRDLLFLEFSSYTMQFCVFGSQKIKSK